MEWNHTQIMVGFAGYWGLMSAFMWYIASAVPNSTKGYSMAGMQAMCNRFAALFAACSIICATGAGIVGSFNAY